MKYSDIDEKGLVEKSKEGKLLAFEELLRRNKEGLLGWLYSLCRDQSLVEEVYQITTIKCWQNIGKFKGQSKFLTWACTISRNLTYDIWKKKKRYPTLSLEEMIEKESEGLHFQLKLVQESDKNFVSEIVSKEDANKIYTKLDKILSPKHKEALLLSVEEGYSCEEIAKKQRCPVGTVMSRIFYAKKEARRHLKGTYEKISK